MEIILNQNFFKFIESIMFLTIIFQITFQQEEHSNEIFGNHEILDSYKRKQYLNNDQISIKRIGNFGNLCLS